ncbi:MAG: pyruvate ferredoxin oxidoreductase [SAR324 cluster bacterium]|nr:pyruvate ferredoxin oxidoreductase [SAR324 cluster bacterium]
MKTVLEGSHAISEAVKRAGVKVIAGYPITPQTHIIEALADDCANNRMDARFISVESEHSAMAVAIGASSSGVRTFTATSSHGLALMHELLHWASAARLPIVMAEVNRSMGPGWNIWVDQTDSLSQRDTGWLQFYCEDGQEAFDTTLLAYRLAEMVNLPVMVIIDAFFISHTYENIDLPDQNKIDEFLPPFSPQIELDVKDPHALHNLVVPQYYMEMRRSTQTAMEQAKEWFGGIEEDFHRIFNRKYGEIEAVECDDAEIILVVSGSAVGTARQLVQELRSRGEKVGLLKIKMFRPFPFEKIRQVVRSAKKIAVIDRNFSFGASGIFAQEIRAALCGVKNHPPVFGYIAGLGGRDITPDTLEEIYTLTKTNDDPLEESIWIGLNPEVYQECSN